jgi:hypothetical protein
VIGIEHEITALSFIPLHRILQSATVAGPVADQQRGGKAILLRRRKLIPPLLRCGCLNPAQDMQRRSRSAAAFPHHGFRIMHHASRITHHASRIMHHASRITHHASRITHHASRITHHASRITHHGP